MSLFHKQFQRYPNTLSEIKELANAEDKGKFKYSLRENKEFLSSEQGCDSEYNVLNNEGGWFYNPNDGRVKINLNKPMHTYFSNYFYKGRNTVPSDL